MISFLRLLPAARMTPPDPIFCLHAVALQFDRTVDDFFYYTILPLFLQVVSPENSKAGRKCVLFSPHLLWSKTRFFCRRSIQSIVPRLFSSKAVKSLLFSCRIRKKFWKWHCIFPGSVVQCFLIIKQAKKGKMLCDLMTGRL